MTIFCAGDEMRRSVFLLHVTYGKLRLKSHLQLITANFTRNRSKVWVKGSKRSHFSLACKQRLLLLDMNRLTGRKVASAGRVFGCNQDFMSDGVYQPFKTLWSSVAECTSRKQKKLVLISQFFLVTVLVKYGSLAEQMATAPRTPQAAQQALWAEFVRF